MKKTKFLKFISKALVACMVVIMFATGDCGTLVSKAGQREDVVALARSQVGYHEKASNAYLDDYYANSGSANYTKYARDLGVGNGQPWCAYFVWWVLQASGVDPAAYPRSGWVPTMAQWFKNAGLYRSSGGSYVPNPGDIVFFGNYGHVGLVEYVSEGYVHCIEGNSSDRVRQTSYNLYTSTYMVGFGIVNYKPSDITKPTIIDVKVIEQTANSYTVQCTVTDDCGVAKVQFPTWTDEGGQDDITWDELSESANGVFTYTVNIDKHGNAEGIYHTHIYAHDTSGNVSDCQVVQVTMDKTAPTFSVVEIRDMTSDGFKLQFQADDNLTGVQHVGCLAYTSGNESSIPDNWYEQSSNFATNLGANKWEYEVKVADHDNARGSYDVKLLAYDKCNNVCEYIIKEIVVPSPESIGTGSVAGDIANAPMITESNDLFSGNEQSNEDAMDTHGIPEEQLEDTEIPDDTQSETPAETSDDTQFETSVETPDDTQSETPVTPDDTQCEIPVETPDDLEAETPAETPDDLEAETPAETPDDTQSEIPEDSTGDVTFNTIINVENNYTTIVNNYISNNTYVQDGVTYAAEDVPVLDTVPIADSYTGPQTVYIQLDTNETIEQLQATNPESAVSGALAQYAENCVQSAQNLATNSMENENEQIEEYEPTEAINVLNEIRAETGGNQSISYTTTIDGRKVTFKITLK